MSTDVPAPANRPIDRLIGFLPNVIASGLILVLGLMLARLVRNLVGSA